MQEKFDMFINVKKQFFAMYMCKSLTSKDSNILIGVSIASVVGSKKREKNVWIKGSTASTKYSKTPALVIEIVLWFGSVKHWIIITNTAVITIA